MFHQPTANFDPARPPALDTRGPATFVAAAYIDAMRAVGAKLHPVRGRPGSIDIDGTFTVDLPSGAASRRRVGAIEQAFAPSRAADPLANGRIAQCLFDQAAKHRFVKIVGDDFAVALQEMKRLEDTLRQAAKLENDRLVEHDPAHLEAVRAADIASEDHQVAFEHVLAMPIRRRKDVCLKAEFALRFCESGSELKQVLVDIVTYGSPDVVGTLPDRTLASA